MESGVLKYTEVDNLPFIPNLIRHWTGLSSEATNKELQEAWGRRLPFPPAYVFNINGSFWRKIKGPAVGRRHPLLAHAWRDSPGLYLVYCEPEYWPMFDPLNVRVPLFDHVESNTDWRTYRGDGTELVWVWDELSGEKKQVRVGFSNKWMRLDHHPTDIVSEESPKVVGDIHLSQYWAGIGSHIGRDSTTARVDEAGLQPVVEPVARLE